MSHSKQRVYIAIFILGFILCVGLLWTLFYMNQDDSAIPAQNAELPPNDERNEEVLDLSSDGSQSQSGRPPTVRSLSDVLTDMDKPFDRKHALLPIVNEATEQELVGVFLEVCEYPTTLGSISTTYWFQSIVLIKLTTVGNDVAQSLIERLDESTAKSVIFGVMREWNQIHVNEAVTLLSSLDTSLRRFGFEGLISGTNFLARSELLAIGAQLGFGEDYVTRLLDRPQLARAQISFEDLEKEFVNIRPDDVSRGFHLRQIAVAYVRANGLDSLQLVLELFDKQPREDMSEVEKLILGHQKIHLVAEISQDDPEEVFEYVLRLGVDVDADLLSAIGREWFKTDPAALWNRLAGEDLHRFQDDIATDLINFVTHTHPDVALMNLDKFPSEYHDNVYLGVATSRVENFPRDALELLPLTKIWTELQADGVNAGDSSFRGSRSVVSFERIIFDAAESDPIGTIEWLDSHASQLDESVKQKYLDEVYQSWTNSDPDEAFETALRVPTKDGESGLEATVVKWLVYSNVDHAVALLPRVREGETKLEAYRTVATQLVVRDRIPDAVRLGNDLPEHDREEYNQRLASRVGMRTPFTHLEEGIRELPSKELQSEAAHTALMYSRTIVAPDLSEPQRDQLKEYLNDDDRRLIEILEDLE